MLGMFKHLFGGQSPEHKSAQLKSAEACFTDEELQAIKAQHAKALQSQGGDTAFLQEPGFVRNVCGLPDSDAKPDEHRKQQAGLVGRALFRICCGMSQSDDEQSNANQQPEASKPTRTGITVEDLIVAKAACDRQGTESSQQFAFNCLCTLASLDHNPSTPHKPVAAERTITPEALKHALSALCAFLMLYTTDKATMQPSASEDAVSAASEPPAEQKQAESGKEEEAVTKEPAGPATNKSDSVIGTEQNSHPAKAKQQSLVNEAEGQGSMLVSMKDEEVDSWAKAISTGALWCAAGPAASAPASCLDYTGYVAWVKMCKAWQMLLVSLLQNVGKQLPTEQIGHPPRVMLPSPPSMLGGVPAGLLNPLAALLMSYCMPEEHRKEWKLVFNGHHAGRSFNTLMGRLGSVEGATLMLVREAGPGGHLIAGYAPAPWRKHGTYYGQQSTWVARLLPDFQVFYATGVNTNYQWCGQGFSQLPNGLGFGGAQSGQHAFALLLDGSLETGQSRPIATFGSPSLTKDQVFKTSEQAAAASDYGSYEEFVTDQGCAKMRIDFSGLVPKGLGRKPFAIILWTFQQFGTLRGCPALLDTVEVWLVQQPEEEDDVAGGNHTAGGGTSALDKANTDRVILGLAGKAVNHSEGYRAKPAEPIE